LGSVKWVVLNEKPHQDGKEAY